MIDIEKQIRPNIKNLKPYSSARNEFIGNNGVFLDANENPFGEYNRYPDPDQKKLKQVLSKLKKVTSENIFLGNGSDEAIDLVFRIFCEPKQHKALQFSPTYGMYEVSAAINNVELLHVDLTDDFQIDIEKVKPFLDDENVKLIFICSPNNPTGNAISKKNVDFILKNFNGVVIIDEAYIDFSTSKSFVEDLATYNNLIVLQTFSKAWGMAGARVGMAFSNPTIINYFNKIKSPYNISQLNQKAVLDKLNQYELFEKEREEIIEERKKMAIALLPISFVKKVYPSEANFLLVAVTDANKIYQKLIDSKVIVRNRTSVIRNCIRITIGTKEENQQLLTALKTIANE
jgi:histidinol-phosphate aminotransferase